MNNFWFRLTCMILTVSLFILPEVQGRDFSQVEIETISVRGNIYMLKGSGGNLGVCIGEDGVFLIDDQFAPLTEKILKAIADLTEKPVRLLINTHYHYDHVGGNENIGKKGTVIISHENVRKRMNNEQFVAFFKKKIPAYPHKALPIITFSRDITFHVNGEEIEVFHVNNAHTDGDAVIYFKQANVLHSGDIYFNGIYPFIDTSSNGSVDGVIKGVEQILAIVDDETKIIPGHGTMSNKKELQAYHTMLVKVRDNIFTAIKEGKSLEHIQSANPTAEFDKKFGHGFLTPENFVTILFTDLSSKM